MRALVTGATGFVGSHLLDHLLATGAAVTALARRPDAAAALRARGVTVVAGALDDDAALITALADCDAVYHVAGLTAGTPAALTAVNAEGTARLAALVAAHRPAARFIHISSQAALGPSAPGRALTEDAPCRPVTAYGRSKLAAEEVVRASPLRWTIVRPPAVYGPRDREFLALFRTIRSGLAPVFGDGSQQLSLVYVEDLAHLIAAAAGDAAQRQILHAAHAEVVRARDVATTAGAAIGRRPLVLPLPGALAAPLVTAVGAAIRWTGRSTVLSADKMAEFLAPAWLLDVAKADRLLGWRAATTLADGMARTAAWYRDAGWL